MMVADTIQATIYGYFDLDLDVILYQITWSYFTVPGEIPHGARD